MTTIYEIRLEGHLDSFWCDWFEGMQLLNMENGEALLKGALPDQAALHGVIEKIRDLNLVLLSVKKIDVLEPP